MSSDEFDDEEAWNDIKTQQESTESDDSDDSDVTIGDPFSLTVLPNVQQHQVVNQLNITASTPPPSALMSKLFPKLIEKKKVEKLNVSYCFTLKTIKP